MSSPERPAAYPPDRWYGPGGSKKFHYFDNDLRALCGKWMLWRDPVAEGIGWGVSEGACSGDCAGCTKKLAALYPDAVDPDTGRVKSHA